MSNTDLIARLREAWLDDAEERCLVSDAADALTAQARENADLADVLLRNGFVRCDIAACNCGSWHARYGMRERLEEVHEALADAGHPLCNENGNLVSRSLQALIAERDAQARELEALRADAERWRYAVTHCEWRRTDNEDGRYSMLVVRLPYEADQSCVATRNQAIDAAMQSGKAVQPHDNRKCSKPKCNGNMRPGTYLEQTFSGVPDFPGDTHAVTVSPAGPGRLAECLKCDACGHSVTAGKAVQG